MTLQDPTLRALTELDANSPPPAGQVITPEMLTGRLRTQRLRSAAITTLALAILLPLATVCIDACRSNPRPDQDGDARQAAATASALTHELDEIAARVQRLLTSVANPPSRSASETHLHTSDLEADLRYELATARADALPTFVSALHGTAANTTEPSPSQNRETIR